MGILIKPKGLARQQLIDANIPEDYWECDFSNYQGPEKAKDLTKRYLKALPTMKESGVGILYGGPNGPGKTTLAMISLKYLARAGWIVYATSLGELVETIQKGWKSDSEAAEVFKRRCKRANFLLIDDVGKEHRGQTGFVTTVFDNLIRHRIQHRLPTFLTTNFTKSEMEGTYGEAVISLLDGRLLTVVVDGKDYRQEVLKKEIKEALNETR